MRKPACGVIIRDVSTKANSDNFLIFKRFQSCVARKKIMIDDKQLSNDISTRLDISSIESSHKTIAIRDKDVKDFNDDDIGTKMNKQIPLEGLSPTKARLNYD
jgi:hypothetical protein